MPAHYSLFIVSLLLVAPLSGCAIARGMAINMAGNALASGGATFESDEDIELVGDALPFALKFIESLLAQSPDHRGLLLAAAKDFTAYSYAYVEWEADQIEDTDLGESLRLRARASRLYLRANGYGMRRLDESRRGFSERFRRDPNEAVLLLKEADIETVYWTAASLALAISAGRNDPAMLVRIREVDALLGRAFQLDESWDDGALHEFEVVFAASRPGTADYDAVRAHFDRAVELSGGTHAGLYVSYAESVAIPRQDAALFSMMLERALAIDADAHEEIRLTNRIAQEKARWLLGRTHELILVPDASEGDEP